MILFSGDHSTGCRTSVKGVIILSRQFGGLNCWATRGHDSWHMEERFPLLCPFLKWDLYGYLVGLEKPI